MSNKEEKFDYKEILKDAVKEHYSLLDKNFSYREMLIKEFVLKMIEFSKSNVLATSLHAFRMFFSVLGMSEAEDLALDIINKEKLPLNTKDSGVFGSCAYSEEEIKNIMKNNKRE